MEIGISTFGEVETENVSGHAVQAHRQMQELVAEAKTADAAGLHVFAVGEHHRPDYIVSAPEVVLGGIATVTQNIQLSSSVTVLSSADPVRTFQNFATVDLLSGGRAEILAGRGSFIESYPLFGYNLDDYNELFIEKLNLLMAINEREKVTWQGKHRPSIHNLGVYPRPLQPKLPIWIGMGGTPQSAVRAGKLGLPLTLAILGGQPLQYVQLVDLYRQSARQAGHNADALPVAINCHTHISEDSQQASDEFFPVYEKIMNRIGKERGWQPMTRRQFEWLRGPEGPLFVGSVEEVTNKIVRLQQLFNNTRFLGQIVKGEIPEDQVLNSIELLGKKVLPEVEKQLSQELAIV